MTTARRARQVRWGAGWGLAWWGAGVGSEPRGSAPSCPQRGFHAIIWAPTRWDRGLIWVLLPGGPVTRLGDSGSGPSGELAGGCLHAVRVAQMLTVANCHTETVGTGRMTSVREDPVSWEAPHNPARGTAVSSALIRDLRFVFILASHPDGVFTPHSPPPGSWGRRHRLDGRKPRAAAGPPHAPGFPLFHELVASLFPSRGRSTGSSRTRAPFCFREASPPRLGRCLGLSLPGVGFRACPSGKDCG